MGHQQRGMMASRLLHEHSIPEVIDTEQTDFSRISLNMSYLSSSGLRRRASPTEPSTTSTSQDATDNQEDNASGGYSTDPADASRIKHKTSRLQSLPTELRLRILEYVVASKSGNVQPPLDFASLAGQFAPSWPSIPNAPLSPEFVNQFPYKPTPCHWITCKSKVNVFYKPIPKPESVISLLSVDRKTRQETLGILPKFPPRADLIYIKDSGFWLTWLSTPFQTRNIPELYVQVRTSKYPMRASQFRAVRNENLWDSVEGGGCDMLVTLMTGILHGTVGPWYYERGGKGHWHYRQC